MKYVLNVRVTRKRKCREGFYLLVNGARLHYKSKRLALAEVASWLALQRVQVVTVREFAERNRKRIVKLMPRQNAL